MAVDQAIAPLEDVKAALATVNAELACKKAAFEFVHANTPLVEVKAALATVKAEFACVNAIVMLLFCVASVAVAALAAAKAQLA